MKDETKWTEKQVSEREERRKLNAHVNTYP